MTEQPNLDLLKLAKRCEQATEADQDALLQEAWAALFPKPNRDDEPEWQGVPGTLREPLFHDWKVRQLRFQALLSVQAFLDAAMALVPEGMRDELEITTLYLVARVTVNMNHGPDGSPFYGSNECNSIPLALCAAALRARLIQQENPNAS